MLDSLPPEEVVKLLLEDEANAVKAVRARAAALAAAAQLMSDKLAAGGRLIYVGVGTAGRLGALEAAECVPAFGLPQSLVTSIIAGGPHALARVAEAAQDNPREADQRMRRWVRRMWFVRLPTTRSRRFCKPRWTTRVSDARLSSCLPARGQARQPIPWPTW